MPIGIDDNKGKRLKELKRTMEDFSDDMELIYQDLEAMKFISPPASGEDCDFIDTANYKTFRTTRCLFLPQVKYSYIIGM